MESHPFFDEDIRKALNRRHTRTEFPEILREVPWRRVGAGIGKIASGNSCVTVKTSVPDLAYEMDRHPSINAVGVVDEHNKILGLIVRKELFDILGKPYGRDVMKHKSVERVMRPSRVFPVDRNMFTVSEELQDLVEQDVVDYFLLSGDRGEFAGIFSTHDILVAMSRISRSDIQLARSVQRSLVREELTLAEPAFRLYAGSRMAKGVGGDFYQAKEYKSGRWIVALCDVSGKGIAASLLTTSLSGMFHLYDFRGGVPIFIKTLNEYIHESFDAEKFITGFFLDVNAETGEALLFDMGHSLAYLKRGGKLFRMKTKPNLPLGCRAVMDPEPGLVRLKPDEALFFITDGILEQIDPAHREYGDHRVATVLREEGDISKVSQKLFQSVLEFRGSQTQRDDMTILAFQYTGVDGGKVFSGGHRRKTHALAE